MNCCDLNKYDKGFEKACKVILETQKKQQLNGCCFPVNGNVGPTGPTGATGATGENGSTPSFAIGTVTTGAPGSEATVTIKETKNLKIEGGNLNE